MAERTKAEKAGAAAAAATAIAVEAVSPRDRQRGEMPAALRAASQPRSNRAADLRTGAVRTRVANTCCSKFRLAAPPRMRLHSRRHGSEQRRLLVRPRRRRLNAWLVCVCVRVLQALPRPSTPGKENRNPPASAPAMGALGENDRLALLSQVCSCIAIPCNAAFH